MEEENERNQLTQIHWENGH